MFKLPRSFNRFKRIELSVKQLKKLKSSKGAHGYYLQISPDVGFKCHQTPLYIRDMKYGSFHVDDMVREFKTLNNAYIKSKRNIPKPISLVILKISRRREDEYYVGYTMSHISGKPLKGHKTYVKKVINDLFVKLASKGVYHLDLHSNNIIMSKDKAFALDFDSRFVKFQYTPIKYGGMEEWDEYGKF